MTSTTTFGGFNPEGRNSSKVLKPPGGGSSDIFGTGNSGHVENGGTPARRVKNHQVSSLFLNDNPAPATTPARSHGKDTHSRLFGTQPQVNTPSRDHMRSNILLEDQANSNVSSTAVISRAKNGQAATEGGEMNGGGTENGHSEPDSGAGPQNVAQQNGNPSPPLTNGNSAGPAQPRIRVPPGGYSSGLW